MINRSAFITQASGTQPVPVERITWGELEEYFTTYLKRDFSTAARLRAGLRRRIRRLLPRSRNARTEAQGWLLLADLYLRAPQTERCVRKALALAPRNPEAHAELQLRWDLSDGMCLARLAETFGITWECGWGVSGYARHVANCLTFGRCALDADAVAHYCRTAREGKALRLPELFKCETPPEDYFGSGAYHEACLLFVAYLWQISATNAEPWAAFRRFLLAKTMEPGMFITDLEKAFRSPMEQIECDFATWVRQHSEHEHAG